MTAADISSHPIGNAHIPARTGALTDRRFFFIMSAACALLIFAGFSPSYYLKGVIHAPPPLSAMTHVHGVVFTLWVLVFVSQAALVGYGMPALHRRLGVLAAVLFGIAVATGIMTAINAGRLGHAPPGSPAALVFMAVPLTAMTGATVLIASALWNRTKQDFHMRYMIAGLIVMTPPAIHRMALGAGFPAEALWIAFAIANILLAICIFHDVRTRKTVHPAYLWSVLVYVLVEGGIVWTFASPDGWLPTAQWFIQA